MKFLFCSFLFFVATNLFAETLTLPFKIKLVSKDGKINFKEYQASLYVECTYKKFVIGNIIDHTPGIQIKRCGEFSKSLIINESDEIEVSGIDSFDNRHGRNLDNLRISIGVRRKSTDSGGIASISVEGEKLINKLISSSTPINFQKFKISDLVVMYKGQNFFDSELVNQHNAGLVFSLNDENFIDYKKKISVRGENTYYSIAYTGQPNNNGTNDIHMARSISTDEIILASYGDEVLPQEFRVAFKSDESEFLINRIFVNRTVNELEAVKVIELK